MHASARYTGRLPWPPGSDARWWRPIGHSAEPRSGSAAETDHIAVRISDVEFAAVRRFAQPLQDIGADRRYLPVAVVDVGHGDDGVQIFMLPAPARFTALQMRADAAD